MSPDPLKQNAFVDALNTVLARPTKASSSAILSKSKSTERKIDEEQLLEKSKRVLRAETKRNLEADHVKPDPRDMDRERKLRKVATRGVVKLFNALNQQKRTVEELQKSNNLSFANSKKLAEASKESLVKYLGSAAVPVSKSVMSNQNQTKDEDKRKENTENKWAVVSDNYMTDAKLKDWDEL